MAKRKRRHSRTRKGIPQPDLDIVIPVYGQKELVQQCIEAITASEIGLRYQIILVDDASPEPSIPDDLPDGTKVLVNTMNSGFPATANRGVRAGRAPLILLLNSDCIMRPDGIAKMVETFSDEKIGIVGAKLLFPPDSEFTTPANIPWIEQLGLDRGNLIQHAGMYFGYSGPEHIRLGWPGDHPKVNIVSDVQAVTGACMMTRRACWDSVRALWTSDDPSEGAFSVIYGRGTYEDVEYCILARMRGWRVIYQPAAVGIHHTGASARGANVGYSLDRNRNLFFIRAGAYGNTHAGGQELYRYDEFMWW